MSQDKIIAMAEAAGLKDWWDGGNENYNEFIEHLSRFRDLVLEEAAVACDNDDSGRYDDYDIEARILAKTIRALKGEKP